MHKLICWVTREDIIKNERVRDSNGAASIVCKMRVNSLRWFGHVMRRNETELVKVVMRIKIEERRRRGDRKKR